MAAAEAGLATDLTGKKCKILMAGNPTHLEGPLYRASTSERDLWYLREITADPDDPMRTPRVSIQWAREKIAKYGKDNPWVLVNVFGKFPDHVFLDGGHTIDFTNKAFEVLDHAGWQHAGPVLPTLVQQTAGASRAEESGAWRHPYDLTGLLGRAAADSPARLAGAGPRTFAGDDDVDAWPGASSATTRRRSSAALDRARDGRGHAARSWPGPSPTPRPCG